MLRNYTLVTDDVDLARRSDSEGCVEVENGEKGKKRRWQGGESDRKREVFWHWLKGQALVGVFSFLCFLPDAQIDSSSPEILLLVDQLFSFSVNIFILV